MRLAYSLTLVLAVFALLFLVVVLGPGQHLMKAPQTTATKAK